MQTALGRQGRPQRAIRGYVQVRHPPGAISSVTIWSRRGEILNYYTHCRVRGSQTTISPAGSQSVRRPERISEQSNVLQSERGTIRRGEPPVTFTTLRGHFCKPAPTIG